MAPVSPSEPFVGSNGAQGGIPVPARQIGLGPGGESVTLGTEGHPFDLPQLLDEALRRNPSTRQAWEQTMASVANVKIAQSAYASTVTLQGTAQASHSTNPGYQGGGNSDTLSAGPALQIQYLLLDFGARAAGVEAARFRLLASDYNQNAALQNLVLQVESAYYALDGAKAGETAAGAALETAKYSSESANRRLNAGLGTSTAAAQADQAVAQARYNLETAHGQVEAAQVTLAASLGLPGNAVIHAAPPGKPPTAAALSENVDALIDRALRQRPDVAAQYATWRQDAATAKQAEANRMPQVTVGASAQRDWYQTTMSDSSGSSGFSRDGSFNGHTDQAVGALTFSFDLFDGGLKLNQARLAHRNAEAARAGLAATELAVISAVVSKFVAFKAALQQYSAGEALVASSQKAFDAVSAGYKAGLSNVLELLVAQGNLASARSTLAVSRTVLFTSSAQLANATGSLLPPPVKTASIP